MDLSFDEYGKFLSDLMCSFTAVVTMLTSRAMYIST